MKPKIARVDISPLRLLSELERAQEALAQGDQSTAQASLAYAVERLQAVRMVQDVTLDAAAKTPEPRAERVVPPLHEDAP